MRVVTVLVSALLLNGCASGVDATSRLKSTWVGRNTDDFIRLAGPPTNQYTLRDGHTLSTFVVGSASVGVPSVTTVQLYPTAFGSSGGSATTSGGGDIHLACTLEVEADAVGKVVDVKMRGNSIGMWQLSRCAEILGRSQ